MWECISPCTYVHPTLHVYSNLLWIVTWKCGCPRVSLCVCSSHPACGHTPWLECVHASLYEFMSTWLAMSAPSPCIVWWKHGCLCVALCVCHNQPTSGHIPCLECIHASVHIFMSSWFPLSDSPLPPLIGGPTSNWRSHLQLEVPPPNGDPSCEWRSHLKHPTSVPTLG